MTLFSNIDRSYTGYALYAEPDYEFLDRSAREDSQCIRDILEDWFSRYPRKHKKDILRRFQSSDKYQHISASFELLLHQSLLKLGCSVELHPKISTGKGTHPDFKATDSKGNQFYLETVQCTDIDETERGANARLNTVYDTINRLKSREFFIGLNEKGIPRTPPSGNRLKKELSAWLSTLNADEIQEKLDKNGPDTLPIYSFQHEDWEVIFKAIPRAKEKRNQPADRVIGMRTPEAKWLNTWERLRNTLSGKGKHYGKLELPLVIAVNATTFHLDNIDIMQALFGQEEYIFDVEHLGKEPIMRRKRNGLWRGPGQQYSRISAVLIGYDIKPWTFGVRSLTLYVNPWASRVIEGALDTFPLYKLNNSKMEFVTGTTLQAVLNLPQCYPGMQ